MYFLSQTSQIIYGIHPLVTNWKSLSIHFEEASYPRCIIPAPIFVDFRLINKETGEIKTQEAREILLWLEMGTFIINEGERIIVSQLVHWCLL